MCAVFKLFCFFIFVYLLPYEREQEVHKCIHPKHSRVTSSKISNVVTKETSQLIIVADTVALMETANKFSQSLRGLIYRCTI